MFYLIDSGVGRRKISELGTRDANGDPVPVSDLALAKICAIDLLTAVTMWEVPDVLL